MNKKIYDVGVYYDHGRTDTITFKRKWQQQLFHWLLNKSIFHNGTMEDH